MRSSKPHGFVAWIFDFYVVSFAVGACVALTLAVMQRPGTLPVALTILCVALAASVVYHAISARRTHWLSPGERIAGRFRNADEKIWLNPYRRTRWPLFAIMLLVTILAGNTWDGIGRGAHLPLAKVAADIVALAVLVVGLMAVGRGNSWGMLAPAAYCLLVAGTALTSAPANLPRGAVLGVAAFVAFLALLCFIAAIAYRGKTTPPSAPQPNSA